MTEPTNSSSDPVPKGRNVPWVRPLTLAAAAVFAHLPALRAGFVLDDRILISENPYVRSLSGLPVLLRRELFLASAEPRVVPYYRPLTGLLNWLSFRALGASAVGQHAFNLGLHALVTALFFRALRAHGIGNSVAFSATLMLAVHPASSEIVAYLGGRQDMAGWLLLLIAAIVYPRLDSTLAVAAVGFCTSLLGALFHEFYAFAFLPLACLGLGQSRVGARRRLIATLGAGVAAVSVLLGLRAGLGLTPLSAPSHNLAVMARACAAVAMRLIKDVFWPDDLAVDVTATSPTLAGSAILLGAAVVTLVLFIDAVRRRQRALFGIAAFGASLVVLSAALHAGVFVMFGHISDRYAYGMLCGVLIGAASAVTCSVPAIRAVFPLLSQVQRWIVPALAIAMVPLTWSRDASWHDETSLQLAMIADRPFDPESRLAAGMLYFGRNELDQAYPHCVAYATARPESEKAHLCIGLWLVLHDRANEAVPYLRRYALARPGIESARRAYLVALFAIRDFAEAQAVLEEWTKLFPNASDLVAARAELLRLQAQSIDVP